VFERVSLLGWHFSIEIRRDHRAILAAGHRLTS
jgi:hypothetical protein